MKKVFFLFFIFIISVSYAVENQAVPKYLSIYNSYMFNKIPEQFKKYKTFKELVYNKFLDAINIVLNSPKVVKLKMDFYDGNIKLRQGLVKKIDIKLKKIKIDKLMIESASFKFQDCRLDLERLFFCENKKKKIKISNINKMDFIFRITEKALNDLLKAKSKKIKVKNPKIILDSEKNNIILEGKAKVLFFNSYFRVVGNFYVKQEKLYFEPYYISFSGMKIPGFVKKKIVKHINPVLDLKKFPFDLNLKRIVVRNKSLVLTSK